jgi:hypothetical protein
VGLSYDPTRVVIETFAPAPGIAVMAGSLDETAGWLSLDLMVTEGYETAHAVAAVRVLGAAPGPVPLIFTSGGATLLDGTTLPVATSDGALYVARAATTREP